MVNDPVRAVSTDRDSAAGKRMSKADAVTSAIHRSGIKMANRAFAADQHGEMQ
jgi:hypothetical protein